MPESSEIGQCRRQDQNRGGRLGAEHTIFVDGIGDEITYACLSEAVKFGTLYGVFIQQKRRQGRRCRFGFVRYRYVVDAQRAVRGLNGALVLQSLLEVNWARYRDRDDRKQRVLDRVWRPKQVEGPKHGKASKQVWRVKEAQGKESFVKGFEGGPVRYHSAMEESALLDCLAVASLKEVYTLEVVQQFLASSGLGIIYVKPLGAREVVLQFQSAEERSFILKEGMDF